jgi:hypothetical protein
MGSWSFRAPSANLAALAFAALALLGAVPTGAVFVTTLPSGADVWLDGTYVGHSPVVIDALAVGMHHLTLTRTGWTPADLPVTVAARNTQTTSVVLERDAKIGAPGGSIAVHAPERPQAVLIDGLPASPGTGGTYAASAGAHDVTIVTPQGKETRSVTVYPQTRTDLVLGPGEAPRSVVIAPADDYLPPGAFHLNGTLLTIHYGGHDVIAHIGLPTYTVDRQKASYDAPPTLSHDRVYLPLELLTMLTRRDKK